MYQNKKENQHHNCKALRKGAKQAQHVAETRSPQPGSQRSQRNAHRTQQFPDGYHALHEEVIGPRAVLCNGSRNCRLKGGETDLA